MFKYLKYLLSLYEKRDTNLKHLPLADTPLAPILLLGIYLFIVKKWGPRFMATRKPYSLRNCILWYNFNQVIINSCMVIWTIGHFIKYYKQMHCIPSNLENAYATYYYYLSKYLDLVETVIFVFRKKHQQVSFLHVYHHIMIIGCTYLTICIQPGGAVLFYGFMNCFVHAIMYSYYYLSTLNSEWLKESWLQQKCLTKKNVTKLQLIQFVIVGCHFFFPWWFNYCDYSPVLAGMGLSQCFVMIGLFSNFYYRTYLSASGNTLEKKK